MNSATLHEIKKELGTLDNKSLLELCLKLAKYKKENKEFLNYLLFEKQNTAEFTKNLKQEVEELFQQVPKNNLYFMGKGLRKILKLINKNIKFANDPKVEMDLLLFYCSQIKKYKYPLHQNIYLPKLYERQIKRINKAMNKLHEDLQFDYQEQMKEIL